MILSIFQVDAFTNVCFGGNSAAVCPLATWLPDATMQQIAMENNLSETAFFLPKDDGFHLRWFTPAIEVDLCGHATLATAHVLFQHLNFQQSTIHFYTKVGQLSVQKVGDFYVMNFPTDPIKPIDNAPADLIKSLGVSPVEVYEGRDDYLVIVENQAVVENVTPDFRLLKTIKKRGAIVSSKGVAVDFVSRGFFPAAGIDEDPVTGSAHTTLIPYWTRILGKTEMTAKQISDREGFLKCKYLGERVEISGQAVTYLEGKIFV